MRLIHGIIFTMDWAYMIRQRAGETVNPRPESPFRPPSQRSGPSPTPQCVKPLPHPPDLEEAHNQVPTHPTSTNNINNPHNLHTRSPLTVEDPGEQGEVAGAASLPGPARPTSASLWPTPP